MLCSMCRGVTVTLHKCLYLYVSMWLSVEYKQVEFRLAPFLVSGFIYTKAGMQILNLLQMFFFFTSGLFSSHVYCDFHINYRGVPRFIQWIY